jgi:predicted glycosyltransferase
MSAGRVFVHVQHLLGVGHLNRAAAIVRAMTTAGLDVTVAQGGFDVPGVEFGRARIVRLPAARSADAVFSAVVDADGRAIDDAWKAARAQALIDAFDAARPDVIMIELYPFGRRAFAFELDPLLAHAHARTPRPAVVCSLRDILVRKTKPGRDARTAETVERWFDRVLVHGDPDFCALDETFSETARLAPRLIYTGLVGGSFPAPADAPPAERLEEVIVSGGGGAVAAPLFRAALEALPDTPARAWTWRFLCGPNLAAAERAALSARAPANAVFEDNRADFPDLLARAGLSISQAGYNTVLDIVARRPPAVFVPFAEAGESEQTLRARRLAERGFGAWVSGDPVDPADLARAVVDVLDAGPPDTPALDVGGAAKTAAFILDLADGR